MAGSVPAAGTLLSAVVAAGEDLPASPEQCKEQIGLRTQDSKSGFPKPVQAPPGAPTIVLVFVDNFGWEEPGVYGGGILRGPPRARLNELTG